MFIPDDWSLRVRSAQLALPADPGNFNLSALCMGGDAQHRNQEHTNRVLKSSVRAHPSILQPNPPQQYLESWLAAQCVVAGVHFQADHFVGVFCVSFLKPL